MCQYPKSDNIHFYNKMLPVDMYVGGACQYPKSDNIHFYKEEKNFVWGEGQGVNTLNRITFISTECQFLSTN